MRPVDSIDELRPEKPENQYRRKELIEFIQCGAKYAELNNFSMGCKTLQTEKNHYEEARKKLNIDPYAIKFYTRNGKIYVERLKKITLREVDGEPEIHEVKISTDLFHILDEEDKDFLVLKDDRDYKPGDILTLNEWDGTAYVGNRIESKIRYVQRSGLEPGLEDGYCIVGF